MPPSGEPSDLLAQFLASEDGTESENLLTRVVGELVEPIVSRAVGARVANPHAEDVRHDALAELIARLRDWKDCGGGDDTRDFRAYCVVAARNGCDDYYRRLYPQRYRLQKRLRYLLSKDRRFGLWLTPAGDWMCGRREWRPADTPNATEPSEASWKSPVQAATLLDNIFKDSGASIPFDDLVDRVAHHWGIVDHTEEALELASTESVHDTMENRGWLKQVWTEVVELPARQRAALLLNLRDDQGGPALALFPLTGVASMREIAAALEISVVDLARMWKDLPWDDQRIATLLSLTRQQVASLRKSARERLGRRLR